MRRSQRIRDACDPHLQGGAASSGTGLAVRNVLPVPVESSGASSYHPGRCGAAPLMATTIQTNTGGRRLGETTAHPARPQNKRQRMKWTKELNISIMHAYFLATRLEADMEGYRTRFHEEWLKLHPDIPVSEQRVCDQQRTIIVRNFLSTAEINTIKENVRASLGVENRNETDEGRSNEDPQDNQGWSVETNSDESCLLVSEQLSWTEHYEAMKTYYHSIPLSSRPWIPRVRYGPRTNAAMEAVNNLLKMDVEQSTSLEEVVSYVSCAALAVVQGLGKPVKDKLKTSKDTVQSTKPPWLRRIECKIESFRRDIGTLTAFFTAPENATRKVSNAVRAIGRKMKIRRTQPNFEERLRDRLEYLKQRVAALGCRIRRYHKAMKRRQQNAMYSCDQKKFFRQLNDQRKLPETVPKSSEMEEYWSNIWSIPKTHDDGAYWIAEEERKCCDIPQMCSPNITQRDIFNSVRKTQNWKAPGTDGIQNFWWKYFPCTHAVLARWFQAAFNDPTIIPASFTEGVTFMISKSSDPKTPSNYRPITCLPTVYKIFTSVLANMLKIHVNANNLLAPEQNGCRKGAQGCKELLIVDSVVVNQAKKRHRNISLGWVDYTKAFDSIPHSWLLYVLRLYKVNAQYVNLIQHCMATWRTKIRVSFAGGRYTTKELKIKRGIFQGDSLSPLWFSLALNPLSRMLRDSDMGYEITKNPRILINHQFYMDDLKLYARDKNQLSSLLELVKSFSDSICMEFGIDKCAAVHVKRGKILDPDKLILMCGTNIQELGQEETYKYLGVHQLLSTSEAKMRRDIQNKVLQRVAKICKTLLNGKNLISAINTWAVPVAVYTFGVLHWTTTALQDLNRKVRTTLTKYRMHHPNSSMARLYLPRNEGGRGLLDFESLCAKQINNLRKYFLQKTTVVHEVVCATDKNFTPLNLNQADSEIPCITKEDRLSEWTQKRLHGRFPAELKGNAVNMGSSVSWLTKSGLFAETEGFVISIQDEVTSTRNYQRYVIGDMSVEDRCRLCNQPGETLQHIMGGCSALAQTEYLSRHNDVAAVVHQALAAKSEIVQKEVPYYKFKPDSVLETKRWKLLWNVAVTTDRRVEANRPDIIWVDKFSRKGIIVDIAIPLDRNIAASVAEKKRKYQALAIELSDMWRLVSVDVVPVVISANGLISKELTSSSTKLGLKNWHIQTMQKAVLLSTARIVRKFLLI